MDMFTRSVYSFILLLLPLIVKSQVIYKSENFDRYSSQQGLINNNVHCLVEDQYGYIWCGTEDGTSRYDGRQFYTAAYKNTDPALKTKYVNRLTNLDHDHLALVTRGGIFALNSSNLALIPIDIKTDMPIEMSNNIADCALLKDKILAVTSTTGFYVFDSLKQVRYAYTHFNKSSIGKERIFYGIDFIKVSESELLVYVQDHKLFLYDVNINTFTEILASSLSKYKSLRPWDFNWTVKKKIATNEVILFNSYYKVIRHVNITTGKVTDTNLPDYIDDLYWASDISKIDSNLYSIIGFNSGFYLFSIDENEGRVYFNKEKQLNNYRCYSMIKTRQNKLVIGTDKGILVEKDNVSAINVFPVSHHLNNNLFISQIEFLNENKLLVAAVNKSQSLFIYDLKNQSIIKSISIEDAIVDYLGIVQFSKIGKNIYLINTNKGLYTVDIITNKVEKFTAEANDDYYFPTNRNNRFLHLVGYSSGKILKYDKEKKTITQTNVNNEKENVRKKHLCYDEHANLLMAGYGICFQDSFGKITNLDTQKGVEKLNYFSISASRNNNIYMGGDNSQLIKYSLDSKIWSNYTIEEDHSYPVFQISNLIKDKLFLASGDGLFLFNTKTDEIFNLSKLSHYPEERTHCSSFIPNEDSTSVYFATSNHLVKYTFNEKKIQLPKPIISIIKMNGEVVMHHPGSIFSLKYNEQNLNFTPTVLYFGNDNLTSSYRVNDSKWTSFDKNIEINLLRFGKNKLDIKYATPNYTYPIATYHINLIPPLYKARWFRLLMGLLAALALFYELRRRMATTRKIALLNQQLAESEMLALRTQMNPHFIFNSLSSIKGLIVSKHNDNASTYLSLFADLMRKTLNHSKKNFITIKEQCEYLQQYLSLENLRYENLVFHIEIDKDLDAVSELIPTMMLQPLVENAVWYGHLQNEEKTQVLISFSQTNGEINCIVDDNGCGINRALQEDQYKGNKIAINNIKERIRLYNEKYKINCELNFVDKSEDRSGSGTIATLKYHSIN